MQQGDKVLKYVDRTSRGFLWQKAFLLLPLWSLPLVMLLGLFLGRLGTQVFEVGYLTVIFLGLAYFIEDVLKQKIRIGEDYLYFGYKKFKLTDLSSVGLSYRANRPLPVELIMYFGSGRKLKLKLSRLNSEDFETLLTTIENRFPRCNIDPVVATLTKCKRLARRVSVDEPDRIELPYNSRKGLKELVNAFMTTASSWMRAGPTLGVLLASPIWLGFVGGFYMSVMLWGIHGSDKHVVMGEMLTKISSEIVTKLTSGVANTGQALYNILTTPTSLTISVLVLLPLLFYIMRLLFRPNALVLDPEFITYHMKVGNWSMPLSRVAWSGMKRGFLLKPKENDGHEKWMICLDCGSDDLPVKLQLCAIQPEDRSRLTKGLERWAPHCSIDAELAEAMMPRQNRSYTELWLQSLTAPAERANLDPLSPGQILHEGRFEVLRRLGIGGQGQAYLCTQTMPGEKSVSEVVLKETILPVFVEAAIRKQALERFEQEARILENLDSDSIVKLLDYFIEDHRGYLVLEHIDGRSLRQIVQEQGAMSETKVKELAVQMCAILEYLHGKGVIHRDFTPDNLMLSKDGKLKLIDFNVAQVEAEGSSGVVVGKHSYLPPEQFRGKPTTQSDIYAMGATLHFLLTGQDPEPISESSPKETNAGVSDEMDGLVRKCTALQASKRAAHVAELKSMLAGAEEDAEEQGISLKVPEREGVEVEA